VIAIAGLAIIVAIVAMSIGFAVIEFRRVVPLAFRCTKCGESFTQPPHHEFPRECPSCGASDCALRA
jgi:rRNA maturation endonuclease Nob1